MKKVKLAGTVYCTVITCVLVGYYLIATKHSYTALGGSNKMVPVVYFKSNTPNRHWNHELEFG
jgi:hypothetical protein